MNKKIGRPRLPKGDKKVHITMRLNPELVKRLKFVAKLRKVKVTHLIEDAVYLLYVTL